MSFGFQQQPEFPLDIGALPAQIGGRLKWGVLIVALVLAFLLLSFLRSVYTDLLWFDQFGFKSVYLKVLLTRSALFVVGAAVFGVPAAVALYFANKVSQGPEELPLPQATRDFLRGLIFWGTIAVGVGLSAIFGAILAGQWEVFLRFGSAVSFDTPDPVYGKDVSFYVFSLPLYRVIQGWLLGAGAVILLATLARCFANFSFRGVGFDVTTGLKVQVSIIAAIIMFVLAMGHWLDRWALLLSDQGLVFGATYTDLEARKAALFLLTIFAVTAGLLILVNGYMRGIRLLVGGIALWLVMTILLGTLWPNAVQRFTVTPNELDKEEIYIGRNIEFTRRGFGLADVAERLYPVEPSLTAELVNQNVATIDNIRLWDRLPISAVYRFDQVIRPYYDFLEADVDRYVVGGEYRQVMLAAREVALEKLAVENPESQTWINKRLRYTHGFGLAMSPVTEFTEKGRPEFFAKDIPSDGTISVQPKSPIEQPETVIANPRIYYGEQTTDYVLVNTNTPELDYQASGELSPESVQYYGSGGVPIGSFIRRVAYAWQMADLNILITEEVTPDSRIQYRRAIQERISTVAPFLRLDEDPYIVAAEGQMIWVQDAYTTTDGYPYSQPLGGGGLAKSFNYIRNSVKVTVDAFDGTLTFYIWDPTDPLVRTYSAIYPDLFVSRDEMPDSLRAHVRYPQDLFGFQAATYLKYHMQVPSDFYNLEDIWSLPREKFGQSGDLQPVDPYYVIMKIPGEEQEEFVLLLPYTRNEPSPVMAGWIAARSDGDNYGQLVAFNFPKDRRVKGPEQIEADIDTDETISEWFTLRCDESLGSFCIRGNLLVVPVAAGNTFSLLYAEPIYLQAESVDFPALKKVILATDERVVMEDSVEEAVFALTGLALGAARADEGPPPSGAEPEPAEVTAPTGTVQSAIDGLAEAIAEFKKGVAGLESALQSLQDELSEGQ